MTDHIPAQEPNGIDQTDRNKEPQPGEAWLVEVGGHQHEAILDIDGFWFIVDISDHDYGDGAIIQPIARLVPETPRKVLLTLTDYENAPLNTVVRRSAASDWLAIEKNDVDRWYDTGGASYSDAEMAKSPRTVLWEPEG